jgi:hypothetical protein
MQCVEASVIGVAAPLDVATFLQLVDVRHDATRQHTELTAQRLLAASWFGGDGPKNPGVRRGQVDGRHLLGELRRRIVSELSEKEGDPVAVVVVCAWHSSIIQMTNRSFVKPFGLAPVAEESYRSSHERFIYRSK